MQDESGQVWEVVGGGDKGGILVREGQALNSAAEAERLSTGALVRELELLGERLWFERLTGSGPGRGWVSINLKDKALTEKTSRLPTAAEAAARASEKEPPPAAVAAFAQAKAAMAPDAKFEAANDAFTAMAGAWACKEARPELLLARGLLLWRWHLLGKAAACLKQAARERARGAPLASLALELSVGRWGEAKRSAEKLGRAEVIKAIEHWESECTLRMHIFLAADQAEILAGEAAGAAPPGMRRTDLRIAVAAAAAGEEEVALDARLLLHLTAGGEPATDRPLVLVFHREEESVDSYLMAENLEPFRKVGVSLLVVGYRSHKIGEESQSHFHTDADKVCDALPGILKEQGLPWPWPGKLALFGSSLGTRPACYLTGMRGQTFDGGVILETPWCGSHAPGAEPPPLPEEGPSLRGRFKVRVWNEDVAVAAEAVSGACQALVEETGAGVERGEAAFGHVRGSEDFIRSFDGKMLVLHGEQEMFADARHSKRLIAAAESSTRKLVLLSGKDKDNLRGDARYADALKAFFG